MTPRALVIGIGQPSAGDDGVGISVVVQLRSEGGLDDVACETFSEPSTLVDRLMSGVPTIVVDALLGGERAGDVVVLDVDSLTGDVRPFSTHGISVAQSIALARALAPDSVSTRIRVVGIGIDTIETGASSLSPSVAAAVPIACARIRELLREVMD